ncbi:MAG: M23 family metallopeptidase [Lachnospiraceae bacterium]|nr:M23 family metallopeptidase [Lachnospiraceae bacterium]
MVIFRSYRLIIWIFFLSCLIISKHQEIHEYEKQFEQDRRLEEFRCMNLMTYEKQGLSQLFKEQYEKIFRAMKKSPIRTSDKKRIRYENSWGEARTYGGERKHEGTDFVDTENRRGEIPIFSISDGVVENIGWLPLGGYRIGIRSPEGVYFYYAHLYRYGNGIKEKKHIKAGQLLGYMGDSGYGEEGTIGQFPVHLHLGIYIPDENGNDMSINPYYLIEKIYEN